MNCAGCGCRDRVLCVFQGDEYRVADNRAFCFDGAGCNWPQGLVAAQLILDPVATGCDCPFDPSVTVAGLVPAAGDDGIAPRPSICFEFSARVTAGLARGHHAYRYSVVAQTINGSRVTLDRGRVTVR